MLKILIRADASIQIGSGHIMRCLTLAHALSQQGHQILWIMRALQGHWAIFVRQQGFTVVLLPEPSFDFCVDEPIFAHSTWLGCSQQQDIADCAPIISDYNPDWIVCDHYALSSIWQNAAKEICKSQILVIDDLHDRPHAANVLLDQNFGRTPADYQAYVLPNTHLLLGTRYALLRPEFAQWRAYPIQSHDGYRVLVNLGGVDKDNITLKILHRLAQSQLSSLYITVVMGLNAPHIESVKNYALQAPFSCEVVVQSNNMAQLMAQSDWAIGAGGGTTWERCCLGLPALTLILADNQRNIAQQLHHIGASYAFEINEIETDAFIQCFDDMPKHQAQLSQKCATLCDGLGVSRVVEVILQSSARVRRACMEDCELIYAWRNHPNIRQYMHQSNEIAWENHKKWFEKQMLNSDYILLLYEWGNTPMGSVNFTRKNEHKWEWGFYTAPNALRGQGMYMGRVALEYAKTHLSAQSIYAQVLKHNIASIRLHQKLGFLCLQQDENCVYFGLDL